MIDAISEAERWLAGLTTYILAFCRYAMIVTLMAIFIIVCVGVFFRYVLNNSLVWTEEIAKFAMVWLAFIGSPVAMERGGHVAIEIISSRAKGWFRLFLIFLIQVTIITSLTLLLWKGVALAVKAIPQHSTAVRWLSMIWVYLSVPVGALLMLPVTFRRAMKDIVDTFRPIDEL